VRAGFLTLAAEEPGRICVVDATLPVDEVAEHVWGLVGAVPAGTDSEPEAPRARISR
jgi:thymidylate kinase